MVMINSLTPYSYFYNSLFGIDFHNFLLNNFKILKNLRLFSYLVFVTCEHCALEGTTRKNRGLKIQQAEMCNKLNKPSVNDLVITGPYTWTCRWGLGLGNLWPTFLAFSKHWGLNKIAYKKTRLIGAPQYPKSLLLVGGEGKQNLVTRFTYKTQRADPIVLIIMKNITIDFLLHAVKSTLHHADRLKSCLV